jgi:uncharacterized protein YdhG (YjbR/CyaY superfamily)
MKSKNAKGAKSAAKSRPATIAQYIAAAPAPARKKLRETLACIRQAAPGAGEMLKYGMPAFVGKRILVICGAFQNHIGLYPSAAAIAAFPRELAKFHTAKGSVQFPLDRPLPRALIRKLVAFRVQDSAEKDGKWKTP